VERLTRSFNAADTDVEILRQMQEVGSKRKAGDWENSLPVVEVGIPQTVTIDCPLVRPYERFAVNCEKCAHFQGVVQVSWDNKHALDWSQKYAVRCGWALERKTRQLVIE